MTRSRQCTWLATDSIGWSTSGGESTRRCARQREHYQHRHRNGSRASCIGPVSPDATRVARTVAELHRLSAHSTSRDQLARTTSSPQESDQRNPAGDGHHSHQLHRGLSAGSSVSSRSPELIRTATHSRMKPRRAVIHTPKVVWNGRRRAGRTRSGTGSSATATALTSRIGRVAVGDDDVAATVARVITGGEVVDHYCGSPLVLRRAQWRRCGHAPRRPGRRSCG